MLEDVEADSGVKGKEVAKTISSGQITLEDFEGLGVGEPFAYPACKGRICLDGHDLMTVSEQQLGMRADAGAGVKNRVTKVVAGGAVHPPGEARKGLLNIRETLIQAGRRVGATPGRVFSVHAPSRAPAGGAKRAVSSSDQLSTVVTSPRRP